jgi:hypothetical protein
MRSDTEKPATARHGEPASENEQRDQRVLDLIRRSPLGTSALHIAKASLGHRAQRHSKTSLNMIGLGIAARLCGAGLIEPTRTNMFRIRRGEAA